LFIGRRARKADTLGETLANAASRQLARMRRLFTPGARTGAGDTEEFWALREVSFQVNAGQVLGIIGRNGSGKSTLLKILSRITPPTEGEATIVGRVGSLLEIGTGFHGELTGRENIYLSGTILGMRQNEIAQRFDEIVEFSGVERFIDTPVKHYSNGMYLRLAFAVAAHLRTEILLIDEVLAVGDAAFQRKCIDKMSAVAREGRTVLFISHNIGAVSRLCDVGIVLDAGRIVARGTADEAVSSYGRQLAIGYEEKDDRNSGGLQVSGFGLRSNETLLEPGSPLHFEFRLTVDKVYWNLVLQLGIETYDGTKIVLDVVDLERLPELAQPGQYSVTVALPALWLYPKSYTARVKILAYPAIGQLERAFSDWINIAVCGVQRSESSWEGVLSPSGSWCTSTIAPTPIFENAGGVSAEAPTDGVSPGPQAGRPKA
jgi:lipopolysaccharide transport system ATP-binding protein